MVDIQGGVDASATLRSLQPVYLFLHLFVFYAFILNGTQSAVLMDLPGCTYSHSDAAVLLSLETKTVDYIPFSASLSSLDSGSIETEEKQYSQLPFAALICLFSTRDRPGNI